MERRALPFVARARWLVKAKIHAATQGHRKIEKCVFIIIVISYSLGYWLMVRSSACRFSLARA